MTGATVRTDGAARGNPGPAGVGVVVEDGAGRVRVELSRFLGSRTNNQAEYEALVLGLRAVLAGAGGSRRPRVTACLDSELVVRQLEGVYRVRDPELRELFEEAQRLIRRLGSFRVQHVPRSENRRADRLANRAIDLATGRPTGPADDEARKDLSGGRTAAPRALRRGEESPGSTGQGAHRQGEDFPSVSGERRPVPQKTHRRSRSRELPVPAAGGRRTGGRGERPAGGKGEKVR